MNSINFSIAVIGSNPTTLQLLRQSIEREGYIVHYFDSNTRIDREYTKKMMP